MAKQSPRFYEKSFVPTFGEEFSSIDEPEFDSFIWNTKLVDDLLDKVENYGLDLGKAKHPFFDKNPQLRQGRLAFQMTPEELQEFKKCRKDIIYFANKFVQLMTPNGIGHITLYPYQEEMLLNYQNGKNSIVCGSRQIGKCQLANTQIVTKQFGTIPIYKLWWKVIKKKTILDYCKYSLYRIYDWLD
jgi:hypothetical protein